MDIKQDGYSDDILEIKDAIFETFLKRSLVEKLSRTSNVHFEKKDIIEILSPVKDSLSSGTMKAQLLEGMLDVMSKGEADKFASQTLAELENEKNKGQERRRT